MGRKLPVFLSNRIFTFDKVKFSDFENHKDIDCIVVACKDEWIDHLKKLLEKFKITKVKSITGGGKTGQLSIYNTLMTSY